MLLDSVQAIRFVAERLTRSPNGWFFLEERPLGYW